MHTALRNSRSGLVTFYINARTEKQVLFLESLVTTWYWISFKNKMSKKKGAKWAEVFGPLVNLQQSVHCWQKWIAGPTGLVWKSMDIPPFWDKDNTDSRPAVEDSQQIGLEAWQQLCSCPTTSKFLANQSSDQMMDGSSGQTFKIQA